MADMAESDWKQLSRLKPLALDRLCARTLVAIQTAASEAASSPHERYLKIYKLVQQADEQIAQIFNDLRRSVALSRLARMKEADLVTDEELAGLTDGARRSVAALLG